MVTARFVTGEVAHLQEVRPVIVALAAGLFSA
jgi:hypothetical protein